MNRDLQKLFDEMETGRARLYKQLSQLPTDVVQTPRSPREWSPAQVIEHLAIAEELNVGYIGLPTTKTTPTRSLAIPMMCWVLRHGITVPAPPTMIPTPSPDLDATFARWATVRQSLETALTAPQMQKIFAVHPVVGALSSTQFLQILSTHQLYHQRKLSYLVK